MMNENKDHEPVAGLFTTKRLNANYAFYHTNYLSDESVSSFTPRTLNPDEPIIFRSAGNAVLVPAF